MHFRPSSATLQRCVLALAIAAASSSAATYLFWPLTQDVGVHFAGVHQALVSGRGMDDVWNFRGINYNIYLWALYRTATLFVDFFDRSAFDPLVRGLHLIVLTIGSAVWAQGLSRLYGLSRSQQATAMALMLFGVTSGWGTIPLHAEDVGLTWTLLGWGLAMRRGSGSAILAGVLAGLLPFLKGITALYAVIVVLAAYRAHGRRACTIVSAVAAGVLILEIGLLQLVAPRQISDLLEAAVYQGGRLSLLTRFELLPKFLDYLVRQPVLLPGMAAALFHVRRTLRAGETTELVFMVGIWSVGFVTTFIQGVYYTYHFTITSLAAVYSLTACMLPSPAPTPRAHGAQRAPAFPAAKRALAYLLLCALGVFAVQTPDKVGASYPTLLCVAAVACLAAAMLLPSRWGKAYRLLALVSLAAITWLGAQGSITHPELVTQRWRRIEKDNAKLVSQVEPIVGAGGQLLLATYGSAARTLNVVSACRHYFPVPLARYSKYQTEFEDLAGFQEVVQCFRQYRGKYALIQTNWFRRVPQEHTALRHRFKVIKRFKLGGSNFELLERKSAEDRRAERAAKAKKVKAKKAKAKKAKKKAKAKKKNAGTKERTTPSPE